MLMGGEANQTFKDGVYAFHGFVHRSHNFGRIQGYYGASATIGGYKVDSYNNYYGYDSARITYINGNAGNKLFGGLGANVGLNVVIPMGRKGHEFRLGLESSLSNEFGSYLDFRNKLTDTFANVIAKRSLEITAGYTLEFIFKRRKSSSMGIKLAAGGSIESLKRNSKDFRFYNRDLNDTLITKYAPYYLRGAFQYTKDKTTCFVQSNFGGYTYNFQLGVNYRIAAKKKL